MLPAEIEKTLSLIEFQCEAVAAAVADGEPQVLEGASNALRQAALDFSALMDSQGGARQAGPELRARLQKVATRLNSQRENLLRRSAVVERGLHALVPATQKSTYAAPTGRTAAYRGFAS
jgi:hypothetical protein